MGSHSERRVALVTGAQRGIGSAVAKRLASDGLQVCVNDLEESVELKQVADHADALTVAGDVGDPVAVASIIDRIVATFGRLDVVVSNAAFMTMEPFPPSDWAIWMRNLDVNLTGTFLVVQHARTHLLAARHGRIVIIASETGVVGAADATGYGASKGGLIALARSLAKEFSDTNLAVNAVAPGYVNTPQLEIDAHNANVSMEEIRQRYRAMVPIGRIGEPDDIAATVAFLASEAASGISGEVIQPNGGTTRSQV